ncbi:MAG: formylglycine-generating enzyme family protein [Candidatus Eisenbacteria bacterium]
MVLIMHADIYRLTRASLLAILFQFVFSVGAGAQGVSDIRVSAEGQDVIVLYNLAPPVSGQKCEYDISMSAVFTDSTAYEIRPSSIRGDYGSKLPPGNNRRISWPILEDAGNYLNGDLDIRLNATINRWRWQEGRGGRPGAQLGFELMSDVWFELDDVIESDSEGDMHTKFSSDGFEPGQNLMSRFFVSFPLGTDSWELGLSYGYHGSTLDGDEDAYYSVHQIRYYVADCRIVLGRLWLGLGAGDHALEERRLLDFEGFEHEDWDPGYWYYEVGGGLRMGLWNLGSLSVDARIGTQKIGNISQEVLPWQDESLTFRRNVTSVRVGYTFKLGDFVSMFKGGGRWEPLPTRRLTGAGRLANLTMGAPRRIPRQVQPPGPSPQVVGLDFVYIPGGSYLVGTPPDEEARDPLLEPAPFSLRKQAFFVSKTEVPQQTYQAYVDRQWEYHSGTDYPAHSVSYDEAIEFCRLLTEQDRDFVYSLPTEGEWEIACRGGLDPEEGPVSAADPADRRRCRQNLESCDYVLKQHAWFLSNKVGSGAFPVGLKKPNVIGLQDMLGNVAEWCMREEGVPAWQGAFEAGKEPLRGGSIMSDFGRCRAGARAWEPRDTKKPSIGFRVICRPKDGRQD